MDTPCPHCGAALILHPHQSCPTPGCRFYEFFDWQRPRIDPLTPEQIARVVEICAPGFVFET